MSLVLQILYFVSLHGSPMFSTLACEIHKLSIVNNEMVNNTDSLWKVIDFILLYIWTFLTDYGLCNKHQRIYKHFKYLWVIRKPEDFSNWSPLCWWCFLAVILTCIYVKVPCEITIADLTSMGKPVPPQVNIIDSIKQYLLNSMHGIRLNLHIFWPVDVDGFQIAFKFYNC